MAEFQSREDSLRSFQEIPEKYRPLFAAYPCFNRVQSAVFEDIFESTSSLVVTAPTGSGKTVLFELALVKLLVDSPDPKSIKAIYVAPVKALCNERFLDWRPRFEPLGLSCVEVTGDSVDQFDLHDHQLILTTPEKWDSLTRRWRDNMGLVQMVKLMMIDEVHLLNDPKRGPTLETIVCRMKTVMTALRMKNSMRFLAVSATIFNIEDLALWLGDGRDSARFHRFGNEMRPVALKRVVKGYPQSTGQSPFVFDIQLSYKIKQLLVDYAEGKPVLIFCSTRRGVVQTCKVLTESLCFNFTAEQKEFLQDVASRVQDAKLREAVRLGAGYHHAGLTTQDRVLMQDTFTQGALPVLVATTTLAMGVNLPAHLVIIKSTHQYIAGRIVEYPETSLLQMVGRAGRPQFDTSATAVIMTRNEMISRYQNLLDCKEVLESSLHLHLAEHLNSEIVLFTITDLAVAMDWLRCTFLYQRAFKNPQHYGFVKNSGKVEKDLELMVLREINALKRADLVEMNENGMDISPTPNGRLMSHYYINFNTFQLFSDVAATFNMKDLLTLLADANELSDVQLRVNERKLLNELNINKQKETIRFALEGKIKTRAMKVNCLVQACLGCLPIADPSLQQEAMHIVSALERVAKCLTEFLSRRDAYCAMMSAAMLCKCLHARLWENSLHVARQLDRIGATLGGSLVACGKTSFDALVNSHPQELERAMNRGPPMGNSVIQQVRHLPRYLLSVNVERESVLRCQLEIGVEISNAELVMQRSTAGPNHAIAVIIGDSSNRLLHHRRLLDSSIVSGGMQFRVGVSAPLPQKIFVHLVSEQWVGLDVMRDIIVNPMANVSIGINCHLVTAEGAVTKAPKTTKRPAKEPEPAVAPKRSLTVTPKPVSTPVPINPLTPKRFPAPPPRKPPVVTPGVSALPSLPLVSAQPDVDCCFDLEPDWEDVCVSSKAQLKSVEIGEQSVVQPESNEENQAKHLWGQKNKTQFAPKPKQLEEKLVPTLSAFYKERFPDSFKVTETPLNTGHKSVENVNRTKHVSDSNLYNAQCTPEPSEEKSAVEAEPTMAVFYKKKLQGYFETPEALNVKNVDTCVPSLSQLRREDKFEEVGPGLNHWYSPNLAAQEQNENYFLQPKSSEIRNVVNETNPPRFPEQEELNSVDEIPTPGLAWRIAEILEPEDSVPYNSEGTFNLMDSCDRNTPPQCHLQEESSFFAPPTSEVIFSPEMFNCLPENNQISLEISPPHQILLTDSSEDPRHPRTGEFANGHQREEYYSAMGVDGGAEFSTNRYVQQTSGSRADRQARGNKDGQLLCNYQRDAPSDNLGDQQHCGNRGDQPTDQRSDHQSIASRVDHLSSYPSDRHPYSGDQLCSRPSDRQPNRGDQFSSYQGDRHVSGSVDKPSDNSGVKSEVENILSQVLKKAAIWKAKFAEPSNTVNSWQELERSFSSQTPSKRPNKVMLPKERQIPSSEMPEVSLKMPDCQQGPSIDRQGFDTVVSVSSSQTPNMRQKNATLLQNMPKERQVPYLELPAFGLETPSRQQVPSLDMLGIDSVVRIGCRAEPDPCPMDLSRSSINFTQEYTSVNDPVVSSTRTELMPSYSGSKNRIGTKKELFRTEPVESSQKASPKKRVFDAEARNSLTQPLSSSSQKWMNPANKLYLADGQENKPPSYGRLKDYLAMAQAAKDQKTNLKNYSQFW